MANRNTKCNRLAWSKAARKLVKSGEMSNFVSAYGHVRAEARAMELKHK